VLRLLQGEKQGEDSKFIDAIENVLLELAGRMKIHAAIPIFFAGLGEGLDYLHASATGALLRLGKHGIVQEIIRRWPTLSVKGRATHGGVLSHFHTHKAVEFGLKAFMEEPKGWTRIRLASDVLGHFAPETIVPVYQYVLKNQRARNDTFYAIPRSLVTVAMVTGKMFDDFDAYLARMDAQYQLEQKLGMLEDVWLADDYENRVDGPPLPHKLAPKTSQCFLLKVSIQGLGYLGRIKVSMG
jgi:hypothetical protein